MAKKNASLKFTKEEKQLFLEYSIERRTSEFNAEALRRQKRHAEQMLSITRPLLHLAYMTGKDCITDKEAQKRTGVGIDTVIKRRKLAVQWLMKALGKYKQ